MRNKFGYLMLDVMPDITKSYFTIRKQVYECMMKKIIA
jgi:hypothetical protein